MTGSMATEDAELELFGNGRAGRCGFVAAHPDDELIMAGSRIGRAPNPLVVHVTDGAPYAPSLRSVRGSRRDYARLRRAETVAALALVGISRRSILSLGAPDLEASFRMVALAEHLARILVEQSVDTVVGHAYEGGHPDHDATALITRAALALVQRQTGRVIRHVEAACYNSGSGRLTVGKFLPGDDASTVDVRLGTREWKIKKAMVACHASQREVMLAMSVREERFRAAPRVVFTRAPHSGELYYEQLGLPLRGEDWRSLARVALTELGLDHSARLPASAAGR